MGRTDGRADGRTDGRMDGWMDTCTKILIRHVMFQERDPFGKLLLKTGVSSAVVRHHVWAKRPTNQRNTSIQLGT